VQPTTEPGDRDAQAVGHRGSSRTRESAEVTSCTGPTTSGLSAVATSVVFQLLMLTAIVLRPGIDSARKPISESAIARLGWLAVLGFLASAAAYACLVAALRHRLRNRLGRIGLFMLSYCALATAVTGLCVADTVTTPMAEVGAMGRMHVVAGISAFVVLRAGRRG